MKYPQSRGGTERAYSKIRVGASGVRIPDTFYTITSMRRLVVLGAKRGLYTWFVRSRVKAVWCQRIDVFELDTV